MEALVLNAKKGNENTRLQRMITILDNLVKGLENHMPKMFSSDIRIYDLIRKFYLTKIGWDDSEPAFVATRLARIIQTLSDKEIDTLLPIIHTIRLAAHLCGSEHSQFIYQYVYDKVLPTLFTYPDVKSRSFFDHIWENYDSGSLAQIKLVKLARGMKTTKQKLKSVENSEIIPCKVGVPIILKVMSFIGEGFTPPELRTIFKRFMGDNTMEFSFFNVFSWKKIQKPFSKHVQKLKEVFEFCNRYRATIFPNITAIEQIDESVYSDPQEAKFDLGEMTVRLPDKIILLIVRLLQLLRRFSEGQQNRKEITDLFLHKLKQTFALDKHHFFFELIDEIDKTIQVLVVCLSDFELFERMPKMKSTKIGMVSEPKNHVGFGTDFGILFKPKKKINFKFWGKTKKP